MRLFVTMILVVVTMPATLQAQKPKSDSLGPKDFERLLRLSDVEFSTQLDSIKWSKIKEGTAEYLVRSWLYGRGQAESMMLFNAHEAASNAIRARLERDGSRKTLPAEERILRKKYFVDQAQRQNNRLLPAITRDFRLTELVKAGSRQLAPAIAELCFDQDEEFSNSAANLLRTLGKPAKEALSTEDVGTNQSKLYAFASIKAFGKRSKKIPHSLLWTEAMGKTRFSKIALDQLTTMPNNMPLEPHQMQFITKGLKSADDAVLQDCLSIAALAKSLDNNALNAVGELALSSGPLADQATNILVKFRSQIKKISVTLIAKLSKSQTQNLYGNDPTAHTRVSLARRIRAFKPDAKDLAPLVFKLADPDESYKVRSAITDLFYDAGESSLPPLIAILQSNDTSNQSKRQLLRTLGLINIASGPALKELTSWIRNGDEREREIALESLRLMGPKASSILDVLFEATNDARTGSDAMRAIDGIVQNPDEPILRRLLPKLESKDVYVQMHAAELYFRSGAKARCVLPQLLRLSRSRNNSTRAFTASILGTVGAPSREVVERLAQMSTEYGGITTRQRAIESLGKLGRGAKSAAPTLANIAAKGRDNMERFAAIWALVQLQDSSPKVIDALKTCYQKSYPDEYERFSAVALVLLGEPSEPYQEVLDDLMKNARSDLERKFAFVAAKHVLAKTPDNQLAKEAIKRQELNDRFKAAVKKSAKERTRSR